MNWLTFTITSLAVFRISLLFSKENGAFHIFKKLRAATPPRSKLREGISCLLCESVIWAAVAAVALCWMGEVPWGFSPFYWLACSAVAVVLNQQFTKGDL